MVNESNPLIQKLWNYCDVLRDDGVSYGAYVEQLTYLLFLKMVDEQSNLQLKTVSEIPKDYNWESLQSKEGDELEVHYRHIMVNLSSSPGLLGAIFRKSQNKIQDPAKLKRLISLINGETWMGLNVDVKGEIYEGLLQKYAEDIKSGAGQYFTPRPLIQAIVSVMRPEPGNTICDPACGTGGFFLGVHHFISTKYTLDRDQQNFLKLNTFRGWEIVPETARLCVMNLFLHNISGNNIPVVVDDSLRSDPGSRFDLVLTNPPFGKKSSIKIITPEGKVDREAVTYERDGFWANTSNKQLNFLQHVKVILKVNGRAAIVVPDNVLFEGGAGEQVRKKLLETCDVHTMLRLPTGIFYAQGVKANVLFFDKREASETPWTSELWIYDLRTKTHITLKDNPLKLEDLQDFVKCFNIEDRHQRKETERFRRYSYNDIIRRDKVNLDIIWMKDEELENVDKLPEPSILVKEIIENLETSLNQFYDIHDEFDY